MTAQEPTPLAPPSDEHRRIAQGNYEHAKQALHTNNHDYAIKLLLQACKFDPGNLLFRQTLRRAQKGKYKNNLKGAFGATLSTASTKAKIKVAKSGRRWLEVLELCEDVLTSNPWDLGTQMDAAEACEALGLDDMALWNLDQALQKDADDPHLNRALARLYEKRRDFKRATFMWEKVREKLPLDSEASQKLKDLAASETIHRGKYGTGDTAEASALTTTAGPVDRVEREAAPYRKRIEAHPTEASAYLALANVYRRAGESEKALDVLRQGREQTHNHPPIDIECRELELEPLRRQLAEIEEALRQDASEEKRQERLRLLKVVTLREVDLYRLRAEHYPSELAHRLELGIRLLRLDRVDEAISELQQARKDARQVWRALMYLGFCFKRRNNWRLAQRNFEDALQNLPATEESHRKELLFQLAQGYADNGDLARALDLGHELANIDWAYRDIGTLLDEWEKRASE